MHLWEPDMVSRVAAQLVISMPLDLASLFGVFNLLAIAADNPKHFVVVVLPTYQIVVVAVFAVASAVCPFTT